MAVLLMATAAGAHWALARMVLGHLDAALWALAETEAAALAVDPRMPMQVAEVTSEAKTPSFARLDRFVQIVGQDGTVLARSRNLGSASLPLPASLREALRNGAAASATFDTFGDEPIRLVALPVRRGTWRGAVQVAGSLDDAHRILRSARWLFAGLAIALLAASAAANVGFARRALRPIDQVVARARDIGEGSLSDRLPHPGTEDELGRLVSTLNDMLARIERGLEAHRRFVSDASHELRSPLSRMRAELEVTLRRPRERAEYEETLRSCLDEVLHLSELSEQLLSLARLDGTTDPRVVTSSLGEVIREVAARLRAESDRRDVRLVVEEGSDAAVVAAPATTVGLAVANVLDNALKFSPSGSEVRVSFERGPVSATVVVVDRGPGIAADELPHVFERFHRGTAARGSGSPGFGLGLAISRAALEHCGGTISAENRVDGGARFRLELPLAPS